MGGQLVPWAWAPVPTRAISVFALQQPTARVVIQKESPRTSVSKVDLAHNKLVRSEEGVRGCILHILQRAHTCSCKPLSHLSGFLLSKVPLGYILRVPLDALCPTAASSVVFSLPLGNFKFLTLFSKQSCLALPQLWPTILLHHTHLSPTSSTRFIDVWRRRFP